MAVISYKCPNCGGELTFDPKSGSYKCEYCNSSFTQQQIDAMQPAAPKEEQNTQTDTAQQQQQTSDSADHANSQDANVYNCPSCGAQIVTDATTAATFCYYCHNPVVLSGRLEGTYLPDKIIPFAIDQADAKETFLKHVQKKKYIPRGFFNKKQMDKFTGVYFPYWIYDCQQDAALSAEATKVKIWRTGDIEFTQTQFYDIQRRGEVVLNSMSKNALQKANRILVEGVQPYRLEETKEFSMGYLSGFQAEKRDMEKTEFTDAMRQDASQYAKTLLQDTVQGYTTVGKERMQCNLEEEKWSYLLLPVWLLTYKGRDGHMYYYAMNGQTGTIFGDLPMDKGKVTITMVVTALVLIIAVLIGGWFL